MRNRPTSATRAVRLLARFWLEEIREHDVATIQALPALADTLPATDEGTLTELAVEYQALFGFNVPPYESVFVDPSAMLMTPATARVRALYRSAGWTPPDDVRAGAVDHIGLEMLALSAWMEAGRERFVQTMLTEHLALWVPAFIASLVRLAPSPFYESLADLTLHLIFSLLEQYPPQSNDDPFPMLPPPPVYTASDIPAPDPRDEEETGLSDLVRRLLTPRATGLYITRQDIGRIGRTLDLPGVVGERTRMLTTLFRLAGQYDRLPDLHDALVQLFKASSAVYDAWVEDYAVWSVYARAWQRRLAGSITAVAELARQ